MNSLEPAQHPAVPAEPPTDVAGEVLRRLAGCLAHHVNNALTGVIGYLELSLRGLSARSPVTEHLQASLDCAYQAASAVKRIVVFANRPEAPRAQQPLSLSILAEQVIERVRAQKWPGLAISAFLEAPGLVLVNETVLQAALDHVLSNALEAMPGGGTLLLRVGQSVGCCQLVIGDTGGGIPKEILPYLFQPFHTSKTSGHLGLGLVQCRDLIQLLGGRLDIASIAGVGTTVTITLPSLDACPAHLGEIEADPAECYVL
jgi:two-component system sporulation sensor kinase A